MIMKHPKIILIMLLCIMLGSCASKKVAMNPQTFKNESERMQDDETKFNNDMINIWK